MHNIIGCLFIILGIFFVIANITGRTLSAHPLIQTLQYPITNIFFIIIGYVLIKEEQE